MLALQEQDGVAEALGFADGDALMAASRRPRAAIAWTSDDAWRRVRSSLRGPLGRIGKRDRVIGEGVILRDGEVHLATDADPADDPLLALRAARLAAEQAILIDRDSLERLADRAPHLPDPWPAGARELLVGLLLTGRHAIPVIEALDHRGIWTRILPEWEPVRPARSATRTTASPSIGTSSRRPPTRRATAARVDRPDLLVLSALLHDLGKGTEGDHTTVGIELARRLGARLGFPEADVDVLAELVGNHLLLSEVAMRRDLDDPATIQRVAERVSSLETLRLLAALTEADSRATGPAAWGPSKAQLVALLVRARRRGCMGGADVEETELPEFPNAAHRELLAASGTRIVARAPGPHGRDRRPARHLQQGRRGARVPRARRRVGVRRTPPTGARSRSSACPTPSAAETPVAARRARPRLAARRPARGAGAGRRAGAHVRHAPSRPRGAAPTATVRLRQRRVGVPRP